MAPAGPATKSFDRGDFTRSDSDMLQKILRNILLAISILIAYLLINVLEGLILDQPKQFGPHLATLIGMTCIVVLFVPLFRWLEVFTQKVVQVMVRTSSSFMGRAGLYIFLALALVTLYGVYLHMWFQARLL
jgi:hypothetical protein